MEFYLISFKLAKIQIDLLLLDFYKAFDKVPHERLLPYIKHSTMVSMDQPFCRSEIS
jgi:hypothetical protein